MKHSTFLSFAALLCAAFLASCAGGPEYADVKSSGALTPRPGKGMVLIYRTAGFVSAAYKPYLYINNVQQPARLQRGGFYSYEAIPGTLNVATSKQAGESTAGTRTKAVIAGAVMSGGVGGVLNYYGDIEAHRKVGINLTIQPSQTYYLFMSGAGAPLAEISQEEGEAEISGCHWLNPRTQ